MTYTNESHIKTVKDVEAFFHHIVSERKVNFHPDDMFEDYVSCEGGINTFTLDECAVYNRLMDESFAICEKKRSRYLWYKVFTKFIVLTNILDYYDKF